MDINSFSDTTLLALVLAGHCLMGLAATGVAIYKGRNGWLWLLLGLTCGTAAFLVTLLMKRSPIEKSQ